MGNGKLVDSMIKDGLWDPYNDVHMGNCAELCVAKYQFTREEQDAFCLESYRRAQDATKSGLFADEIAPVEVPQKKGEPLKVDADEEPFAAPLEKMPTLKPAFQKDGTVTAANASKINDGAAALVLASRGARRRSTALEADRPDRRLRPASRRRPSGSRRRRSARSQKLLEKTGLSVADIDLFEINEAFAVVAHGGDQGARPRSRARSTCAAAPWRSATRSAPPARASSRRCSTPCDARERSAGIAAICIGGGEATAMLVETV